MFEPTFTLAQLLVITGWCVAYALLLGILWGRSIQKKRDIWSFGPSYMRIGKPPRWVLAKPYQYPHM